MPRRSRGPFISTRTRNMRQTRNWPSLPIWLLPSTTPFVPSLRESIPCSNLSTRRVHSGRLWRRALRLAGGTRRRLGRSMGGSLFSSAFGYQLCIVWFVYIASGMEFLKVFMNKDNMTSMELFTNIRLFIQNKNEPTFLYKSRHGSRRNINNLSKPLLQRRSQDSR